MKNTYKIDLEQLWEYILKLKEKENNIIKDLKGMENSVDCGQFHNGVETVIKQINSTKLQLYKLVYNTRVFMESIEKNVRENDEKASSKLK